VAEAEATPGDISVQLPWRGIRAMILARAGDLHQAERLAREAVEQGAGSDALNTVADASLDLAEVLRLAGKPAEAKRHASEAIELYRRKGNLVSAARAESFCAELPARDAQEDVERGEAQI
jgi:tetratricopeptide (TPR) repeat protein